MNATAVKKPIAEAYRVEARSALMKAAIYARSGSPEVLEIGDRQKPMPKDDQVLIRVRVASLNPLDWRLMRGAPYLARLIFRLPKPTVAQPACPGRDVAGVVETAGSKVTRFKPGDEVFGVCESACAEYACISESRTTMKPAGVSFEQAASIPVAGLSAIQGLRDKGKIQAGQKVLINGAAGGVGTFAVQMAKHFGAEVTGVCSTRNVELVRSLGADRVVDYNREDFTQGTQRYDLILDCVGNRTLSECRRVMNPRSKCVIVGGGKKMSSAMGRAAKAFVMSLFMSQKFSFLLARGRKEDLATIAGLIATGKVTPVIERRYKLTEIREAITHLEEGHARGKVVVIVS